MPQNNLNLTPDAFMAQQGQGAGPASSPGAGSSALTPDSFMAQQPGTPAQPSAASSPDQSHWYDPITKAWNWATTPFGVVDRATDSD
jgi:hypothetical protein